MMQNLAVFAAAVLTMATSGAVCIAAQADRYRYPPPVDHKASAKARADIAKAEVDLKKAQDEFSVIGGTLRKDLESSSQWKGAQATLKQAQADYDKARTAVLASISDKPQYRAARLRKEEAEAKREALGDDADPARRAEAAGVVLKAAKEVTDIETAALDANPDASAAKKLLAEAADKVDRISKQSEETMKKDPKYKAAQKAVTDAKKRLESAKAALATATQKEAAAERDRQRKIDAIERRREQDARRRRW